MKNKLISIIVPVYNAEKTIERCLKSIISQINESVEMIIINDGSTDTSEEKIEKIINECDGDIKYFIQDNKGVSYTRNKAIDISKGEYIWFIDSDDYISQNCIDDIISVIPGYDLIMFNYNVIGIQKNNILEEKKNLKKEEFYNLLKDNFFSIDFTVPWNKIFKKQIIKNYNIEFDRNLYSNEDFLFNLRYFNHIDKVYILNENIYNYDLTNSNGQSLSKKKRTLEYCWDVTKKLYVEISNLYKNDISIGSEFIFERAFNDILVSNEKTKIGIIFEDKIFKNNSEIFKTKIKNKKGKIMKFAIKYRFRLIILIILIIKDIWRKKNGVKK